MAMATRGPCPALLLPLVLLGACLALARGMPWVSLNNIFKKYHVDFPPTPGPDPSTYCNGMMRDRENTGSWSTSSSTRPSQPSTASALGMGHPFLVAYERA
ncbi:Wnt3a [Platysternon megacephalum]|uniref:Wnt3a n=1 Tax=Platysternon megacephalum TaxID=55544 RepID=A0A4D9DIA7_9SAUR|nr:Wnt3a [Platysternon megacephalum]